VTIVENRKAPHEYFIEERYEAGIALEGWEVKAIRAGRAQLKEAYVIVQNEEIFLIGAHISPLAAASLTCCPIPCGRRKLLLHAEEIRRLIGKVDRAGYTLVPLDLHYVRGARQDQRRSRKRQEAVRQARRRKGKGLEARAAALMRSR